MKTCPNCNTEFSLNTSAQAKSKKWCSKKCYKLDAAKRRRKTKRLSESSTNCFFCFIEIDQNATGRPKKYCSDLCRRSNDLFIDKQTRAIKKVIQCQNCKKDFLIGQLDKKQKFCSASCRALFSKGPENLTLTCLFCLKFFERPNIKGTKPTACMECRTSGPARRYQGYRKHNQLIFNRDKGRCQICFTAVNFEAEYNNRFAPTLDHIIPKALNGSHEPNNLRLAHRWCNSVRRHDYSPHGDIQFNRMVS